jgi:hypothetical protein
MPTLEKDQSQAALEVYRLVVDKCYRMNLLKNPLDLESAQDFDNLIANAIMPAIIKLLDKSLFDVYQVLYTIDVPEEYIKAKIMDLENSSMIPSIIAFAIIDRLKQRYSNYALLPSTSPGLTS